MLTDFQRKKLTHYFNVLDYDNNHLIQKNDFVSIGENLCTLWGLKEGTEEHKKFINHYIHQWEMFRKYTRAASEEHATLEEWLEFADKILVNGKVELYEKYINLHVGEIFDAFDNNKDGYISLDEYIDFFMAYRIEMKYSAKSFTQLDINHDDKISKAELLQAMRDFFRSDDKKAGGNWIYGFWEDD